MFYRMRAPKEPELSPFGSCGTFGGVSLSLSKNPDSHCLLRIICKHSLGRGGSLVGFFLTVN